MDDWADRFWEKVDIGRHDECWEWQATRDRWAYGRFWLNGTMQYAHRVSWELAKGPIPNGLCILHHCDNPSCVNPYHLWVGTNSDNIRDRVAKGRGARGARAGSAKLTRKEVRQIRALYSTGQYTQHSLGRRFGVAQRTVSGIVNYERWHWLTSDSQVQQ